MGKLYWRLKSWYYLKFHGVILGKIADVAIFEQKIGMGSHSVTSLKGSDRSLVEAFRGSGDVPHPQQGTHKTKSPKDK